MARSIVLVLTLAATAMAQETVDMQSLIEQALDQPVDFEVIDKALPEAFDIIGEKTGVPISAEPDVLAMLPHGADTHMTAKMRGILLRTGMERLLRPLGMRWEISRDQIKVVPSDALSRIGRRANWSELETLEWLSQVEWANEDEAVGHLRKKLQFRVDEPDAAERLIAGIRRIGAGKGDEVLTLACAQLGWTWYPWDDQIAVVSMAEQVYRRLQTPVTLRVQHRRLAEVIADLARSMGVTIGFEPGALAALPAPIREDFSLLLVDATAQQALEVIVGASGLGYRIEPDGIVMYAGPGEGGPGSGSARVTDNGDPIVGYVVIPGPGDAFRYQFPVRVSQVPADVRAAFASKLDEWIEGVRKSGQSALAEPKP